MKRLALASLIATPVALLVFVACNTILDNQPGTLVAHAEAGRPPDPGTATTAEPTPEPTPDAGDAQSPQCPPDLHSCAGNCVPRADPDTGCGDPSCTPCPSAHASVGCAGNTCTITACDPGYADCNSALADGCEVDLSRYQSCGTCNTVCGVANPRCTATGGTFQCTNGCTNEAPLDCGNVCVDPSTSTSHCGGCNIKCPSIANATTGCTLAVCTFTCKPGFHACGSACPAKTDPTACGPDCVVCPIPPGGSATCANDVCTTACNAPSHPCGGKCVTNDPTACGAACTTCPLFANATTTCAAEVCGFACVAGFGNCDGVVPNGCEAALATDPLNCGSCGKLCGREACVTGVCQPAAPLPPPP